MKPTIDDLIRTRAQRADLEAKLGAETGLLLDLLDSSHQFSHWQRTGPEGETSVVVFNGSGDVVERFVATRVVERDGYALALNDPPDPMHVPRLLALRLDCETPWPLTGMQEAQ